MPDPEPPATSAVANERIYHVLVASALALVTSGTDVYQWLEDWSWIDSLSFSVVAVTTVGFGDLAPSTDGSKLFTVFYIIAGVSIIGTFLDVRLKRHGVRYRAKRCG